MMYYDILMLGAMKVHVDRYGNTTRDPTEPPDQPPDAPDS